MMLLETPLADRHTTFEDVQGILIGATLDGRSASMICERPIMQTLLIQNLARWPTCPASAATRSHG